MPSYTPQAPQSSYTPMNYQAGGPTQVSTSPVAGAAPVYPTVGNVALPAGYDNTMAAYNDPDYIKAMTAWSQTALPAYQAINNQQNTDREYGHNAYIQGEELIQTKFRDDTAAALGFGGLDLQKQIATDQSNQWGAQFDRDGERNQRADFESDRNYDFDVQKTREEFRQSDEKIQIDRDRQQADAAYQAGTLSINQYVAEMNRLAQVENNALNTRIADQDYERSGQRLQIDSAKNQADAAYQQGTLSINQYKAEMDRLGQIENNARQIAKDRADAAYQQGSLQQQRYSTDTGAQISREQLGQQRYSTDIGAQISREQLAQQRYSTDTGATISREQMQSAYDTAVMQAVGRNQAQNVRWMRG